jgi:hypothetical protein
VFILNKKIFSRTSRPISILKLGTNYPWVKRIKIVEMKDQVLFQGEIITKMQICGEIFEKKFSREPHSQNS